MFNLFTNPVFQAGAYIILAGLLLILRRAIAQHEVGKELRSPLALIAVGLLFGALDCSARLSELGPLVHYFDAVFFGAVGIGVARVVLILFVDLYLKRRGGAVISAIFRDIVGLAFYFLVIVTVLRSTLDINLASLIATSAVLTAIVGLALQDVLANIFSGLVLELEQPFSRGDWVRVGSFEGVVEETGWRTTKIRTRVNELITLPNAYLSKEPIVNYSRPDPRHGDTIRFEADYQIAPSVVQTAVKEVFGADPAVLDEPDLEVRLEHFAESGVAYAVRYWIDAYADLERIRNRLQTKLWYAFRRADVRIPFPARDLFIRTEAPRASERDNDVMFVTLRAIPLLAPLQDDVLRALLAHVRRLTYGVGELIVGEGDQGDSFFVIEQGTADVVVGNGNLARKVAQLAGGGFFGEMSLLAGEPRSATVRATSDITVLMIDRASFRDVIVADPALVTPLSEIVARRQAELKEQRDQLAAATRTPRDGAHAHRLGERIRAFFGLS